MKKLAPKDLKMRDKLKPPLEKGFVRFMVDPKTAGESWEASTCLMCQSRLMRLKLNLRQRKPAHEKLLRDAYIIDSTTEQSTFLCFPRKASGDSEKTLEQREPLWVKIATTILKDEVSKMIVDDQMRMTRAAQAASMGGFHKKRSITVSGFETLLDNLQYHPFFSQPTQWSQPIDFKAFQSEHLRKFILGGNPHPAFFYPELFSDEDPDVVLTYEWKLKYSDILTLLNEDRIEEFQQRDSRFPSELGTLRIWIDILFMDQTSSNISPNLFRTDKMFRDTHFHVMVITDSVFDRAWCLYELSTRRQANKDTLTMRWKQPEPSKGDFLQAMKAKEKSDLEKLKSKLEVAFEGRFDQEIREFFVSVGGVLQR
mmetsp:Transcript_35918/g.94295  ORF Transcript_35918/g.94295 Transcript_35918/m.94295 type:complete len:369 (+) Transcript_35918:468-1574(+)|eukprot:CAMPEP_0113678304 /NCGR_PEP_ID=MMETSP0038_2-20120614/9855_1 /TAXON_ID=2898 /ORGANISM="Cryptomonas paramecium" /LENGTH=368 /DNA_ID=CAMNT_0000595891 /DNA_START=671 /DNA_END=1777 /DNA_ORIENTATION=+ /assembly_acc=CAM_ASM_000170